MGRPSKSRSGADTSTSFMDSSSDHVDTSPVNLSFHLNGATSRDRQQGPAAADGPTSRDVTTQQPDSTVDRCLLTPVSRKRSSKSDNVLRQLQSTKTLGRAKQSSMWQDLALIDSAVCAVERSSWPADVAADLRVKRARFSGVHSAVRAVQSLTAGARTSVEPLADITAAGRRWSYESGEDSETCPTAVAVHEAAVGSPSVTSSGRRDSLDDDDDDEVCMETDCESWMRTSPSATTASCVQPRRHRRRSSVDKKQPGSLHRTLFVDSSAAIISPRSSAGVNAFGCVRLCLCLSLMLVF